MEELDTAMAHKVHRGMAHPDRARVFSSCQYDLLQMTALLRGLDALVYEFVHFLRAWARERLGIRLAPPLFVPMPPQIIRALYRIRGVLNPSGRTTSDDLLAVVSYFNERKNFLRQNTDRLLGDYDFRWREVMQKIMEFAISKAFFLRPEDTVHERLLSRLRSKSLPVTYHDIVDTKIVTHDTENVRDEVLTAAAAMQLMGIRRGDRVALAGPNSTRYLTIDAAIGICGAMSVPIYNTSPAAEISRILSDSRPRDPLLR